MSWYLTPEECDLEAIIASGRSMTTEEAIDIVRRVEAKSADVSDSDSKLAYASLMHAWAKPLGLTLVPDGWWRVIGWKERYGLRWILPGDRMSKWAFTLWAWRGVPVAYVSLPCGIHITTWKEMEQCKMKFGLHFAVFDRTRLVGARS